MDRVRIAKSVRLKYARVAPLCDALNSIDDCRVLWFCPLALCGEGSGRGWGREEGAALTGALYRPTGHPPHVEPKGAVHTARLLSRPQRIDGTHFCFPGSEAHGVP